jgi:transposase
VLRTWPGDRVHSNQICAGKKQIQEQAARVSDAGIGRDAEDIREREIDRLHTKIRPADRGADFSH